MMIHCIMKGTVMTLKLWWDVLMCSVYIENIKYSWWIFALEMKMRNWIIIYFFNFARENSNLNYVSHGFFINF